MKQPKKMQAATPRPVRDKRKRARVEPRTSTPERIAEMERVLVQVAGLSLLGFTIVRLWCDELHGLWKTISGLLGF
jgi:hypothetical protein